MVCLGRYNKVFVKRENTSLIKIKKLVVKEPAEKEANFVVCHGWYWVRFLAGCVLDSNRYNSSKLGLDRVRSWTGTDGSQLHQVFWVMGGKSHLVDDGLRRGQDCSCFHTF